MLDERELTLIVATITVDNSLPLEARIKDACSKARNSPLADLCHNHSANFYGRAAVAAVMLKCTPEERARIDLDLRVLKAIQAATSGVPIDFESLTPAKDGPQPVGLSGIINDWAEENNVPLH